MGQLSPEFSARFDTFGGPRLSYPDSRPENEPRLGMNSDLPSRLHLRFALIFPGRSEGEGGRGTLLSSQSRAPRCFSTHKFCGRAEKTVLSGTSYIPMLMMQASISRGGPVQHDGDGHSLRGRVPRLRCTQLIMAIQNENGMRAIQHRPRALPLRSIQLGSARHRLASISIVQAAAIANPSVAINK
jgi:hypothetical protein